MFSIAARNARNTATSKDLATKWYVSMGVKRLWQIVCVCDVLVLYTIEAPTPSIHLLASNV